MTVLQIANLAESELIDIQSIGDCILTPRQGLIELGIRFLGSFANFRGIM